jgi:hypothetical protein
LRGSDDRVDWDLHESFLDFVDDLLLEEVDFFGDFDTIVQFDYLFVDHFDD